MPKVITTELHEKLMLHYMLLTRQMAKLSDSLLHIIRLDSRATGEKKKSLFNGYRAYAQTELADTICQVKKICEDLGLSYKETEKMGDERDKEKGVEFFRRYPNEPWI